MSEKRSVSPIAMVALLGAVVSTVGCFLPWQRAGLLTKTGLENPDGKIFLGFAGGVMVLSLLGILFRRFGRIASTLTGLGGFFVALGAWGDLASVGGAAAEGLYVVLLGAGVTLVGCLAGLILGDPNKKKAPAPHEGGPLE